MFGDIKRKIRILTYKRTHIGDPDEKGRFGIYDCMGSVRDYEYDAVIGVGGLGREPESFGIDRKINWVGITPTRYRSRNNHAAEITFSYFRRWENQGPLLETLAPLLARRMYEGGARILLSGYTDEEQVEAERILAWARRQPGLTLPSPNKSREPRSCEYRCNRC